MPLRNRKQSANIHDKRHENGLAPPAVKKIPRSRPDAPATTDANGNTSLPAVAKSVDSPDSDDSDQQFTPDAEANGTSAADITMAGSSKTSSEGGSEDPWDASADATADEQEPVAVISSTNANGNLARHDSISASSPLNDFAATIISPQPLRDVVAVLLLLLQLPPSILTIIQICYAIMTLGQPLTGFSLTSLPTWNDWFHSHGGNPSIVTTVITDVMFMVIWFMVTNLITFTRDITLDLAQCVIAMSLGGGTFTKGSWNHSLACMSIVTVPHVVRSRPWRRFAADPLHSLISNANVGFISNLPIFMSARYAQHGWPRMILELHILAQGAVRVIRRWIDRQPGTASSRKIDPEAATAAFNLANSVSNNPSADNARNASSDNRPPGPSPSAREPKEKNVSSGKKRRKQGNFVRSQQPFWAAIASTKVTVTKEIEHTQASKDTTDADAAEALRRGDGEGKQAGLDERAWINSVDQTEVAFVAVISSNGLASEENGDGVFGNGALCARINGARWSHFEYRTIDHMHLDSTRQRAVKGRIYGLTPGEALFVELIDRAEGTVIYGTHLKTRPLVSSDASPVVAIPPPSPQARDSLRPSSPVTTLKKAIAAAEHQLTELRSRSKKTRKDHKTTNANIKKEVDALEGRLTSFSGADDRQRAKQNQLSQTIKQAEDHMTAINCQIDELAAIPDDERQAHESRLRARQEASSHKAAAQQELQTARVEAERQITALRAEHASLRQKIEKAETKLMNQEQKRENLQTSTTNAKREKTRWDAQRAAVIAMWKSKERELIGAIHYTESQRQDIEARCASLQQQSYFHDGSLTHSPNGHTTLQHTPEAAYANLAGNRAPFANSAYPPGMSPYHSRENSTRQQPRGRTSSMLSAISGFTENETGIADSSPFPDFTCTTAGQSMGRNDSGDGVGAGVGSVILPGMFPGIPLSGPASPTLKVGMSPIGSEAKAAAVRGGSPRGVMPIESRTPVT